MQAPPEPTVYKVLQVIACNHLNGPVLAPHGSEQGEKVATRSLTNNASYKGTRSVYMLERVTEEIKRRTHGVRIFPNAESCLRLVRALCIEVHENWLEAHRYLNMGFLRELKKEALRKAA